MLDLCFTLAPRLFYPGNITHGRLDYGSRSSTPYNTNPAVDTLSFVFYHDKNAKRRRVEGRMCWNMI